MISQHPCSFLTFSPPCATNGRGEGRGGAEWLRRGLIRCREYSVTFRIVPPPTTVAKLLVANQSVHRNRSHISVQLMMGTSHCAILYLTLQYLPLYLCNTLSKEHHLTAIEPLFGATHCSMPNSRQEERGLPNLVSRSIWEDSHPVSQCNPEVAHPHRTINRVIPFACPSCPATLPGKTDCAFQPAFLPSRFSIWHSALLVVMEVPQIQLISYFAGLRCTVALSYEGSTI